MHQAELVPRLAMAGWAQSALLSSVRGAREGGIQMLELSHDRRWDPQPIWNGLHLSRVMGLTSS